MDDASHELIELMSGDEMRGWGAGIQPEASMPSDYLNVVRHFGTGGFNDFLWLLAPGCPNEHLNLHAKTVEELGALRISADQGEEVPAEAFADPPIMTPWAVTDNGDVIWWCRRGEDVEDGHVLVAESRPLTWEKHELSISRFLLLFCRNELDSILADDDDHVPPRFRPWQPN